MFTRKDGSQVAGIRAALRSTILKTLNNIHDFAFILRAYNDELAAIHDVYALREWKMNIPFADNLIDAYN